MKSAALTPLALSVLSTLRERAMHPYEILHTMEFRKHDRVIKLRRGSLYSTIDRLDSGGQIVAIGIDRDGRRPERTTYALTPQGEHELMEWLRRSIAAPATEFSPFASLIAFLPHLMPWEAVALLRTRLAHLEVDAERHRTMLREPEWMRMQPLFKAHEGYAMAMREAEIAWVRALVDDIASGRLTWPDVIVAWHQRRGTWTDEAKTPKPDSSNEP